MVSFSFLFAVVVVVKLTTRPPLPSLTDRKGYEAEFIKHLNEFSLSSDKGKNSFSQPSKVAESSSTEGKSTTHTDLNESRNFETEVHEMEPAQLTIEMQF